MLMLKNFTHRQQHALELLGGADAPEEGQQTDQGGGRNQHVDRPGEQVRPEQLVDEVLVDQRPHAEPEHDGTAELKVKKKIVKIACQAAAGSHVTRQHDIEITYENDEIGDEHAILDTLPAAVHSAAGTHREARFGGVLVGSVGLSWKGKEKGSKD